MAPTLVVLGACSGDPEPSSDSAATQHEAAPSGGAAGTTQGNVAGSPSSSRGGTAGRANANGGAAPTGASADTTNGADTPLDTDRGSGGAAQAPAPPISSTSEDPLHPSCVLNETCTSECEAGKDATCGVISTGFACEFEGFTGATAQVACGERVVIGTACCGGCGCVPVELFFDGKHCWQGVPKCEIPGFTNHLFDPHATTKPNPSFVPPSSFYLGNGGIGGGGPVASAAGGDGGTDASAGGEAGDGANGTAGGAGGANGIGDGGATANAGGDSGLGGTNGIGASGANAGGDGGTSATADTGGRANATPDSTGGP